MSKVKLLVSTTAIFVLLCSCNSRTPQTIDSRCPELVSKAEYYNAKVANGDKDGPMGIKMRVEYVDSVYRIIQIIDEKNIPIEKVKMAYGNMKQNAISSISSATGKERNDYKLMVDYHVSFEHVVKSKSSNDVIIRTIITPEEIDEALNHELTHMDELEMWVNTTKSTLPREMETGYTIKDISCTSETVNIEIEVDESLKNFDEAT